MDSTLLIIGTNHRTCQVEFRERFWVGDGRLLDALHELANAPGVDEVVILSTCNRTEYILWAADADLASTAVRNYLVREHRLTLDEWRSFYRHTGDAALAHLFRVTSSLDSMVLGEPQITGQVKTAWTRAQQAGTTGRFLDAAFQKALSVSKRVRNETSIGAAAVSVPYAAVELARRVFGGIHGGDLRGRKVLLLGAGKMSELSARYMVNQGVSAVWVASRTLASAESLAKELGGEAIRFEDRWKHLAEADIVISSTG
ncbi:MAG TPA: glutamyl-tRNA reductase, partial [Candidatus Acidoferrales bacterium]